MFNSFLNSLEEGRPILSQVERIFEDLEEYDFCITNLPTNIENINIGWIKTTDWYISGGYKKVRQAEILKEWPLTRQAEASTDALMGNTFLQKKLTDFISNVKETWPKPE